MERKSRVGIIGGLLVGSLMLVAAGCAQLDTVATGDNRFESLSDPRFGLEFDPPLKYAGQDAGTSQVEPNNDFSTLSVGEIQYAFRDSAADLATPSSQFVIVQVSRTGRAKLSWIQDFPETPYRTPTRMETLNGVQVRSTAFIDLFEHQALYTLGLVDDLTPIERVCTYVKAIRPLAPPRTKALITVNIHEVVPCDEAFRQVTKEGLTSQGSVALQRYADGINPRLRFQSKE